MLTNDNYQAEMNVKMGPVCGCWFSPRMRYTDCLDWLFSIRRFYRSNLRIAVKQTLNLEISIKVPVLDTLDTAKDATPRRVRVVGTSPLRLGP